MKSTGRLLPQVLAVVLLVAPARAADGILTDDTYISSANPTDNFGTLPIMLVSAGNSAWVQFNLSTLPAGTTALDVSRATLSVFATRVTVSGRVDLSTINGAWSEGSVVFQGAPGTTSIAGATAAVAAADQYIVFDVTTEVRNAISAAATDAGFQISADAGTPSVSVQFDTKESTTTSHPAALEITLNTGVAGPSGPPGPPGSPGPAGPISDVIAGTDLTGGGTTPTVTLNVDTTKVPQLATVNTFAANQNLNANLNLVQTTGANAGVVMMNGEPFLHACCSFGASNTFTGSGAGTLTVTGSNDTADGNGALGSLTTGSGNTAVGSSALLSVNTGSNNTATGFGALEVNSDGENNTATGYNALLINNLGINNTAVGAGALGQNSGAAANGFASNNTAVGDVAGQTNGTGSANTFLGAQADATASSLYNATAIGFQAKVGESNAIVLGATGANSVNVGIGTTTPAATLEVNGTARFDSLVSFATGQTFPGAATTGGANSFAGNQSVTGNIAATKQLVSTVATGTAPLAVSSTTQVANLNASFLQGEPASAFQPAGSYATLGANTFTGSQTIPGNGVNILVGNIGCGSPTAGITFSGLNCANYALLSDTTGTTINRPASQIIRFREGNGIDQVEIQPGGRVSMTGGLIVSGGTRSAASVTSTNSAAGGNGLQSSGGSTGGSVVIGGTGVYAVGGTASGSVNTSGIGIVAVPGSATSGATTNLAGEFYGGVDVFGTFYAGSKNFKIDHPLDPAGKYLYHASVESSEMMNIYTGNVTTDVQGNAVVALPDWFEAVNGDFRYQLTVIGQFAQAIITSEIANHQFQIRTDKPNVRVSWQVCGVRQDAYAKAHPLQVEVAKPAGEQGYYLYPELYGAPEEKGIGWARHPEEMKQMRVQRDAQASAQP
jgi:hypothetical protein